MSNAQYVFDKLRAAGMTEAGSLGVLGNLQAESGIESCRLQGDYKEGRERSREYADKIDNGLYHVETAAGDDYGWGLAQWTYKPRKRACLQFCLNRSVSVGNLEAQTDFLIEEFATDYSDLFRYLCRTDNLYEAVTRVCKEFERPTFNNIDQRYKFALKLSEGLSDEKDKPTSEYWPPRMICEGMTGPDVGVLQSVLKARGYTLSDTQEVFGHSTGEALKKFQELKNLDPDAICGPKSWAALLERS